MFSAAISIRRDREEEPLSSGESILTHYFTHSGMAMVAKNCEEEMGTEIKLPTFRAIQQQCDWDMLAWASKPSLRREHNPLQI